MTYMRVRSWMAEAPTPCGHCHQTVEVGGTLTTVAHCRRATAQPDHQDAVRHCCAGCTERILRHSRSVIQEVLV